MWATWGRSPGATCVRKRFVHVGVTVLNTGGRHTVFLPPPPAPRDTRRTPSTLNEQRRSGRTHPGCRRGSDFGISRSFWEGLCTCRLSLPLRCMLPSKCSFSGVRRSWADRRNIASFQLSCLTTSLMVSERLSNSRGTWTA